MGLEMGVHGDGSAGDARADASGLLRIMWATPLLTVPEVIGNDLRERVATAALALHAQWELQAAQQAAAEAEASHGRRQRATGGARSVRGEGGNDLFFRWQRSKFRALDSIGAEGWDAEADTVDAALDDVLAAEDLRALKQAAASAAGKMLAELGRQALGEAVAATPAAVALWFGVHGSGTGHSPHVHKGSMLSGTIYLLAPEGSGALEVRDPRGELPPFGMKVVVDVAEGMGVVFPSWVVHRVVPSSFEPGAAQRDAARVAVSFNVVAGDWEDTADVTMAVPV